MMARPARNANPGQILSPSRTFFVTTRTSMGRALLQSDRNATLLINVLRSYVAARKFQLHDFVVMPDHAHLLVTVGGDVTIEKAMQFVKGGFSFRLRKEFGYLGEVWQRGFSEVRVLDRQSLLRYRQYIAQNPGRAGLADSPENFPYCFTYLAKQRAAGAKAG
ncbi:MAG: REP-associated tyrosine transposase [Terriglobia bacterium]